jgi:signal transduction histidine kinase
MIPGWKQLNFLIKHQLYLRMIPVVVVAVLAVGLFSGHLLTTRAVNTYLEQKSSQQSSSLRSILDWIGLRTLAAEAHKEHMLHRESTATPRLAPGTDSILQGFLDLEGIKGAGYFDLIPTDRPDSACLVLPAELASSQNQAVLQEWIRQNCRGFRNQDWLTLMTRTSWPDGPHMARVDMFHDLWIFEPVELKRETAQKALAWQETVAPEIVPVLPVVVCEYIPWTNPGATVWSESPILLLLDIRDLAAEALQVQKGPSDVGLVLDFQGRVLAASVDSLTAGCDLTASTQNVFRGVPGDELGDFFSSSGSNISHVYLGNQWNPFVFLSAKRSELPLQIVSALPLSQINGGMVLYTAIVVLMAIIALLGSIMAITSVGEALSKRLRAVADNMEEVASGDYSRRMAVGKQDEVGRLVSYFNLMTGALESTHQQLREKTHRLRVALARMRRLDKAKDDFLTLISHEVRTPLTSILGGVELLKVILPTADKKQRELLDQLNLIEITDIIASSGVRLNSFMNDAILMTTLQSTDAKVNLSPVPIADMCELVASGLQESITDKNLTFANELVDGGNWLALCDRDLMVTALDKVVQNAVQHNHQNGVVRISEVWQISGYGRVEDLVTEKDKRDLEQRAGYKHWRDRGEVRWRIVRIFNTGQTIPEDKRESLFRKFEMVDRIEHHQKGSGLSLPIVRAVMEIHGGHVYIQSHENEGTSFYLVMPTLELPDLPSVESGSGDQQGHGVSGISRHKEIHLS